MFYFLIAVIFLLLAVLTFGQLLYIVGLISAGFWMATKSVLNHAVGYGIVVTIIVLVCLIEYYFYFG